MKISEKQLNEKLDEILMDIANNHKTYSVRKNNVDILLLREDEFDFYQTFYAKHLYQKILQEIKNCKK